VSDLTLDEWRPLYLSAVISGSTATNRGIRAAVSRLARMVDEVDWVPADDEAAVDWELHVSGNLLQPNYVGMRTGRWVRWSRVFVVQYAVPVQLEGSAEDEVVDHLRSRLLDAVTLAEDGLTMKRQRLPVRQARIIARTLSA
jgi:hypothetical protein